MKLFGYYAVHTFVNQLKKLLKTWVLVFILVCAVMGGVLGYGAAVLSEKAEDQAAQETVYQDVEEPEIPEGPSFLSEQLEGVGKLELVELAAGLVILAVFVIEAFGADRNGSAIFQPADVPLLFASPMRPQSVLMFRLATQLGTWLLVSLYMLFQLPNLILNAGLRPGAALGLIAGWFLTLVFGKLIQLLLYMLAATFPKVKSALRPAIYGLVGLILCAVLAAWQTGGGTPVQGAVRVLCARWTRFIPLWGWIKGFCMAICEGSALAAVLSLIALLAAAAVMVYWIYAMKVDFYEDAMARSEETAELMRKAQEEGSVVLRRRKKDRSENLRRDGFNHGQGANVFFFKTMYNRVRFSRGYVFSKTSVTYLLAALAMGIFLKLSGMGGSLTGVALLLGVLVFYRALGDPMPQDVRTDWFRLVPEDTRKKLLWSLLGGTVCCLMDLLLAMILGAVVLGAGPVEVLAWLLVLASVDFYATTAGTFIELSVPAHVGKTVKQLVLVIFLYFGLLPDIIAMAIGVTLGHVPLCALISTGINLLLGLLLLCLTPLILEGGSTGAAAGPMDRSGLRQARTAFSRVGWMAAVSFLLGSLLQAALAAVIQAAAPQVLGTSWGIWVMTFAPVYLIAIPVGLLLVRKLPARRPQEHPLGIRRLLTVIPVALLMMYGGNLVGILLNSLISLIFGGAGVMDAVNGNPLQTLTGQDSLFWRVLVMVILAPAVEELLFRRVVIDRLRPYGERLAVVISALLFALYHGNLSQLFYAFLLGLLLGYVYLRTGRIRYTFGLHALINFIGSILSVELLSRADLGADFSAGLDGGTLGFLIFLAVMVLLSVLGLVLLCVNAKNVRFETAERQLPRGTALRTALGNPGMVVDILAGLTAVILAALNMAGV